MNDQIVEREKYVNSELMRIEKMAAQQIELRDELLVRLERVLLDDDTSQLEPNPETSIGVPIADDLALIARHFEKTNMIIEDILNRLEI